MWTPEWGAYPKRVSSGKQPAAVERAKSIQAMLAQGLEVKNIALDLGMTKNAVYEAIRAYGLKIKKEFSKQRRLGATPHSGKLNFKEPKQ